MVSAHAQQALTLLRMRDGKAGIKLLRTLAAPQTTDNT